MEDQKNTWRRTVEGELKSMNHSWGTIEKMAKTDRNGGPLLLPFNGIPGSK